ncbi:hypothetical protein [Citrobacter phage Tr1]|nr:hypothetical protein [Citrobacter phage Tr1]
MDTFYFANDRVGTAGTLARLSNREPEDIMADLIDILVRKELLSDADVARLLGIGTSDLQRSPF